MFKTPIQGPHGLGSDDIGRSRFYWRGRAWSVGEVGMLDLGMTDAATGSTGVGAADSGFALDLASPKIGSQLLTD